MAAQPEVSEAPALSHRGQRTPRIPLHLPPLTWRHSHTSTLQGHNKVEQWRREGGKEDGTEEGREGGRKKGREGDDSTLAYVYM